MPHTRKNTNEAAIHIAGLHKTFRLGRKSFKALNNVSLRVMPGQMVALIGASGSGKSTLLRHIAGLSTGDRAAGTVEVLGKTVQKNGRIAGDIRAIRARIGFIFQQFNIVDRLPVLTNVLTGTLGRIPSWRGSLGWFTPAEKRQAMEALARVGMHEHAGQRSSTLSGGQQQRAAIARALVQGAEILLADEPIASLDPVSARNVMENLYHINQEDKRTVVVSLHQVDYAFRYCERIVALHRGEVVFDGPSAELDTSMLHDIYGEMIFDRGLTAETGGITDTGAAKGVELPASLALETE